jgi:hypothetical protein
MKVSLTAHPQDKHKTILDDDAIIEVEDETAGRLVITFSDGNVVIRDDDFEGAVIHKYVSL